MFGSAGNLLKETTPAPRRRWGWGRSQLAEVLVEFDEIIDPRGDGEVDEATVALQAVVSVAERLHSHVTGRLFVFAVSADGLSY